MNLMKTNNKYLMTKRELWAYCQILEYKNKHLQKKVNNLIDTIVQLNYLRDNGLIIIHRNKKDNETLSEKLNIIEVRYYGLSKITFACY